MEQDTLKIVKRMVGLLLVLGILAGTAYLLLWRFGSPWAASAAARRIEEYLAETYPGRELQMQEVEHNLSLGGYTASVTAPEEKDVSFFVTVKGEEIISDSYEGDVLKKGNTIRRLEREYSALVQQALDGLDLPAAVTAQVRLDPAETGKLVLGMDFSPESPLVYHLMLLGPGGSPTMETAVSLLEQVYGYLEQTGYIFSTYGVQLNEEPAMLAAAQITAGQIKGGNLAGLLQQALEGQGDTGIYLVMEEAPPEQEESSKEEPQGE